jgi:hypothetical protein
MTNQCVVAKSLYDDVQIWKKKKIAGNLIWSEKQNLIVLFFHCETLAESGVLRAAFMSTCLNQQSTHEIKNQ